MIDLPAFAAIDRMSEPELISAYARIFALLTGRKITADEEAQILLALQRIMTALRIKRAMRQGPALRR